jgi:hypothetical protein
MPAPASNFASAATARAFTQEYSSENRPARQNATILNAVAPIIDRFLALPVRQGARARIPSGAQFNPGEGAQDLPLFHRSIQPCKILLN